MEVIRAEHEGTRGRAALEFTLRGAVRRFKPDVALTLGPSLGGLGCPVLDLATADDDDAAPARGALGSIRGRVRAARRKDASCVVPTRASAELLARGRRSIVCPPGVDAERFSPSDGPREPLRAVFVGRLVACRGAHLALEAFNGLPEWARSTTHLDLVGAANDRRYLEALRRKADGLPCTIHTDVPDVLPFLRRASIALMPHTSEDGWGRGILECMAEGLPVVTSRGEVLKAITGGHVEFVPAGNLKALGDVLRRLLRSEQHRIELGAAARQHVLDHYSWEVVLPLWERALEQAAR